MMKLKLAHMNSRSVFERRMHEQTGNFTESTEPLSSADHGLGAVRNEAALLPGENVGAVAAASDAEATHAGLNWNVVDYGDLPYRNDESNRRPRRGGTRTGSARADENAPRRAPLPGGLADFSVLPDSAFVRLPVVCALFSISRATVWRYVKAKLLPDPVKLSAGVTAWRVGDLRLALDSVGS